MPELPEVETIRRALEKLIVGKSIQGIELLRKDYVRFGKQRLHDFPEGVILKADRRGKFISLSLNNDLVLIHHLGMSGRLLYVTSDTPVEKHTQVRLFLDDGCHELRQWDPRRFGFCAILHQNELSHFRSWSDLGADPLSISTKNFYAMLKEKNRPVKSFLLDQHFLAGLGNIYTDESLFRAGIHPSKPCKAITRPEASRLLRSIRKMLRDAIQAGGTSTNDFRKLDGSLGSFQSLLQVYKREGQPCYRCGNSIVRIVLIGRGTHYCPTCQNGGFIE